MRRQGIFRGINGPFRATRYHSLVVDRATMPPDLAVTAETSDRLVMGLAHTSLPVHGVQFHPESIASEHGHLILKNFLELAARMRTPPPDQACSAAQVGALRTAHPPRTAARARRALRGARMDLKALIGQAATGATLTREQAALAFDLMMSGEATPSQMGGLLMALRVRGETVDEITGAVSAMRSKMLRVIAPPGAIDVVGTGGDASGSYNISTCAAFIVAGAGVPVAKHGNRALSSRSGAADVLTALGVRIDIAPEHISRCIAQAGIGFMFAPAHHPAMKHVGPTRVELGTRTIFNLLGPLSNPAGVKRQMVGVFSKQWVEPLAHVLKQSRLRARLRGARLRRPRRDHDLRPDRGRVARKRRGAHVRDRARGRRPHARQARDVARRRRRPQRPGAASRCSKASADRSATSRCSMRRPPWWSPARPRPSRTASRWRRNRSTRARPRAASSA